jgi:esterase/lipase superfamily enzyme
MIRFRSKYSTTTVIVWALFLGLGAVQCARAEYFYDLCVRGHGPLFTKTIRLQLRVQGEDPKEAGSTLGIEVARHRIWSPEKVTEVFAEPYDEERCAAAQTESQVNIRLGPEDLAWIRSPRRSDTTPDDVARAKDIASRVEMPWLPKQRYEVKNGKRYEIIRLNFATNRKYVTEKDRKNWFSADWSKKLTYGIVDVSIAEHKKVGEFDSTWIRRYIYFDGKPPVMVVPDSVRLVPKDRWLAQLVDHPEMARRGIFLFVHGFNVSFEDAARRSGQIVSDIGFEGPAVFFSWPSQAKTSPTGYVADLEAADNSVEALYGLMVDLAKQFPDKRIYVIAHSMGTQILTKAFVRFKKDDILRTSFAELILAAPDMDVRFFEEREETMLTNNPNVTLYAHANDEALKLSKTFRAGFQRLGEGGPNIKVAKGMDSIDASDIPSDGFFSLNHSYIGDSNRMIFDIAMLIRNGLDPKQRNLREVPKSDWRYWVLRE